MELSQMKRLLILPFLLCACGGTSVYKPDIQSTNSPKGPYQVKVITNFKPQQSLGVASLIKLNANKNGAEYVTDVLLGDNEYDDNEWYNAYPDNIWVNESLLRFGQKKGFLDNSPDRIFLQNASSKTIKYLVIRSTEIFVIFDVRANSCLEIQTADRDDATWLSVKGEREQGRIIESKGYTFAPPDMQKLPSRYCVTIKEDYIETTSPNRNAWDGQALIAPQISDCHCSNQ
ncbi:MAG: hypothetical protein JNM09_05235 [Blastocatellia bacterium]|nr:hypothetical protein [Blastocatellia bacterium]